MVVDPGGPGASAVDYASSRLGRCGVRSLRHRRHGSPRCRRVVPIDCLSDKDMDAYLAGDPDPDTPEEEAEFQATNERFAAGCEANAGDLAAHVSTIEAARDMDVLRSALGETELTYFGASYGTELGATYAEYFPDRVGRMVLDGAVDPTLSLLELHADPGRGVRDGTALLHPELPRRGRLLPRRHSRRGPDRIQHLPGGHRPGAAPDPVRRPDADRGAGRVRHHRGPLQPRCLDRTSTRGCRTPLTGTARSWRCWPTPTRRDPDGTYHDNILEAFPTITCLDDPTFVPFDQVESHIAAIRRRPRRPSAGPSPGG